ncbi:hypothetical protein BOTBODRAFT_32924 [Botryobasidium botryosum FD-172 SS1]|uniref:Uncharacterized protein n=1 Tax=Botryobasidium botryosum (strain FD-172 SS1) TaxID=930990 RepID=A0A067MHD4_BOTB1|nr:hypothetical protein BOTBODRAFT_32924 [Botryobasidium botryosum FD-172 SS1]
MCLRGSATLCIKSARVELCAIPLPFGLTRNPGCPKPEQKRGFSGSKAIQTSFDDAVNPPHSKTGLLVSVPM